MKIKAIITGATGMVGEGVLQESLLHPDVESVLVINRKPCGVTHPKLTEIIHTNFFNICEIAEQLKGYNACFFCLGVSSVGLKANQYYSMTYILTMHMAEILAKQNPDMTLCYISGAGTDSTEQGKLNWAKVKGKTENDLMKLPFKKVYAFRPAFMLPEKDAKNAHKYYAGFRVLYPALRTIFPGFVSTLKVVATGMINSVLFGYEKPVLEVKDIVELANK
ncbi:MAG TPA: NAD-dependent epimerase/dehydratase family protein [Bacteroidales bacterium]